MTAIDHITLEVPDPEAASRFYEAAFDLDGAVRFRPSDAPTNGFRGFTLSFVVAQPATVRSLMDAAVEAGATAVKPAAKSLWGFGGALRTPDGTIVTIASSTKKDTGAAARRVDDVVLQLGVEDVAASKRFYVERGLEVAKSFGRRYVEFATPSSPVKLALNKRKALAKVAGVAPEGSGSHRLVIAGAVGPATDPDGFVWEAA
ncbi:MAG TPA: hypothetical protein VIL48_07340 [Acidimicrobiales bacterium]